MIIMKWTYLSNLWFLIILVFLTKLYLSNFIFEIMSKSFHCKLCSSTFTVKSSLTKHIDQIHACCNCCNNVATCCNMLQQLQQLQQMLQLLQQCCNCCNNVATMLQLLQLLQQLLQHCCNNAMALKIRMLSF